MKGDKEYLLSLLYLKVSLGAFVLIEGRVRVEDGNDRGSIYFVS